MLVLQPTLNTVYNLDGWPESERFRLVDIIDTEYCIVKPIRRWRGGLFKEKLSDLREIEQPQNKAYERS